MPMNNTIDGYVLFFDKQFYNLSPAPYSGAIISLSIMGISYTAFMIWKKQKLQRHSAFTE